MPFNSLSFRDDLERCLDSWKGSDTAKRDFRMPNKGLVFEIKTTEKKSRVHTISSADQLTKRENEEEARVAFEEREAVFRAHKAEYNTVKTLATLSKQKVVMWDQIFQEAVIDLDRAKAEKDGFDEHVALLNILG